MSEWNISARFSFFELELLTELKSRLPDWNYIFIFFVSAIVYPRHFILLKGNLLWLLLPLFVQNWPSPPSFTHPQVTCTLQENLRRKFYKVCCVAFPGLQLMRFLSLPQKPVQNRHGWILLNPSLVCSGSGATSFKCGEDTCGPDE